MGVMNYAKAGFGISLGFTGMFMIRMLMFFVLFIPGFYFILEEHKKPREKRSTAYLIIGYVLMGLGVIISGVGLEIFFSNLQKNIS